MLNYANLNDVEFEALCRDIMERKLEVRLRRFASGKDRGVDLTDDVEKKSIIVQVKHYQKSSISALITSLKNELPKVIKLNPQKYYICCSRELSHDKINELYKHFRDYMDSDNQIITILEIDDFLKKPENKDILKKHFKLWLDDTGILQEMHNDTVFVDCEALLSDIEELHKLFVRTKAFDQALTALKKNRTLCIIGNPGVGKSITSKMLVLYYAAQGYRVRYTTDVADLAGLKASLRREPGVKEIILLDDCFGQAYFEMKASQGSELLSLIKYVKLHPDKILILNSRVTIFQEARERQRELIKSMERGEYRVFILDMTNLSLQERAKILYNHLAFSGIPDDYFENLREKHRYREIITHRNYNPRIIEFVCTPSRYQTTPADRFYAFIKKQLNNPQQMWKDEYEERLQPADRILLQTVYSLTNTSVSASLVRQCFDRRIANNPLIDKTVDQFSKSLLRLSEGFITIGDRNGQMCISMRNPSVNDFLSGRLKSSPMEKEDLIRSICTPEQLRLLPEAELLPYAVGLLQTGQIDHFIFPNPSDRSRFIGWSILSAKLRIARFRAELLEYIVSPNPSAFPLNATFHNPRIHLEKLLSPELWEFYDLKAFFSQPGHLTALLQKLDLENAATFIMQMDPYFHGSAHAVYTKQVQDYLEAAIADFCKAEASDYEIILDVEQAVEDAVVIHPEGSYFDRDDAVAILEGTVKEEVLYDLKRIAATLPDPFSEILEAVDEEAISVDGADFLVDDFLYRKSDTHEDENEKDVSADNGFAAIDAIFQR